MKSSPTQIMDKNSNDNGNSPVEATDATGVSSGTNSPRSVVIQRNQANQLLVALKNELALAKAAGSDKIKAQQHFNKAENIKGILLQYQAQQKLKNGTSAASSPLPSSTTAGGSSDGNLGTSTATVAGATTTSNGSVNSQSHVSSTISSPVNTSLPQVPATSRPASVNSVLSLVPNISSPGPISTIVTVEKYTQISNRLQELGARIKYLQQLKTTESNPDKIASYDLELSNLQVKFTQYDKICTYMKKQLSNSSSPISSLPESGDTKTASPLSRQSPPPNPLLVQPTPQIPSSQNLAQLNQNKLMSKSNINLSSNLTNSNINSGLSNSNPTNINTNINSNHNSRYNSPLNSTLPLSYSKPPNMSSLPLSSNIKPPIGGNKIMSNTRPIMTPGGGINYMTTLQVGGQLGMSRIPSYDYVNSAYTPTNIPDNGGRVLTKRKLAEVVNSIGADEGDSKTVLEGDVEDLLLDLADEFVTSITSFACKLAKHRKSDLIDTRDVQVHLERNWNIRVPGHALDEIKATKKWQPNAEYSKKTSSIEQAKSMDK